MARVPAMPSRRWRDKTQAKFEIYNLHDERANCHKLGHSAIQCIWANLY